MGREEQIEEREVLDSIFPDEITDIDETTYRILLKPQLPPSLSSTPQPTLHLTITYPPLYPDTPPHLTLTLPPSAPKPPHLSLPTDAPPLLSSLTTTINENLGIAMIFTLITTLKEEIEALITSRVADIQRLADQEAEEAEAKENAKFAGERVTRESFGRWREGFRREMEEERREESERVRREGEKRRGGREERGGMVMTGRELWERGMVGRGDVEEEEEGGVEEGVEGLRV